MTVPLNERFQQRLDEIDINLHQFLSSPAVRRVGQIAETVGQHKGKLLAGIFLLSAVTKTYANVQLHGDEYGNLAALGSLLLDTELVANRSELNALLVWSHNILFASGVGGAGAGLGEILGAPDVMSGKAENPYKYMSLLLDKTNKEQVGNQHGDFYRELYRLFTLRPDIHKKLTRKYGPICEIGVPEDAPIPAGGFLESRSLTRYFRHNTPNDTDFLRNTVKAERARALIEVIMSKDRTVWDYDKATHEQLLGEAALMENMNSTIIDDLQRDSPQKAMRFIITNDRMLNPYTVVSSDKAQAEAETLSADYYRQKDYEVINAETEVMKRLTNRFAKKGYQSILLVTDPTDEGTNITQAWLDDYNKMRETRRELPAIVKASKDKLIEELRSGKHDAIFIIGSKDELVDQIVGDIASGQDKGGYKSVPLEILMEGRGASNRAENIIRERKKAETKEKKDTSGKIHYVHEYLAQELIKRMLHGENTRWDEDDT